MKIPNKKEIKIRAPHLSRSMKFRNTTKQWTCGGHFEGQMEPNSYEILWVSKGETSLSPQSPTINGVLMDPFRTYSQQTKGVFVTNKLKKGKWLRC